MRLNSQERGIFWSLPQIAELIGRNTRTVRGWIVKDQLIEFRLEKVGRCKVRPIVMTDQLLKLIDLKFPAFGSKSEAEQIFETERAAKSKAGRIAAANRRARLTAEAKKTETD